MLSVCAPPPQTGEDQFDGFSYTGRFLSHQELYAGALGQATLTGRSEGSASPLSTASSVCSGGFDTVRPQAEENLDTLCRSNPDVEYVHLVGSVDGIL